MVTRLLKAASSGTRAYLVEVWADIEDKEDVVEIVEVLVETSVMV